MDDIKKYLKENLIDERGFPTYRTRKAAIISSKLNSCLTCYKDSVYLLGQLAFTWVRTKDVNK